MYEYKFVQVPIKTHFTGRNVIDSATEEIKQIIVNQASEGWKLIQVLTPQGQGKLTGNNYEVIFEKKIYSE